MTRTQRRFLPAVLALALIAGACAKNASVSVQTASQKVAVYNATLAKSNMAVTAGVIELQKSNLLTTGQTRAVLQECELIANASEAVRIAMVANGDWTATAAQIQKILANVNVNKWLSSSGISNPQLETLMQGVQSAVTLIQGVAK